MKIENGKRANASVTPPLAKYFSESEDSGDWAELEEQQSPNAKGRNNGQRFCWGFPRADKGQTKREGSAGQSSATTSSCASASPPPSPPRAHPAQKHSPWSRIQSQNQTISMESLRREWVERQQSRIASNGRGEGKEKGKAAKTEQKEAETATKLEDNPGEQGGCCDHSEELNMLRITVDHLHNINKYLHSQNRQLVHQNHLMGNLFVLLQPQASLFCFPCPYPMLPMVDFRPSLPEPCPSDPVATVVNHWNMDDCHSDLTLTSDFLTVLKTDKQSEFGSVRAKFPMSSCGSGRNPYFEAKIVVKTNRIWIGLSTKQFRLSNSLGYRKDSGFGFTSYGGFWASGIGRIYGRRLVEDDVVGCGLNMDTKELFFTLNGENLGTARSMLDSEMGQELYPTITLCGVGAMVEAKF